MFRLPIPSYDEADPLHVDLVAAAGRAEELVAAIELPSVSFQAQRRLVRETLAADGVAGVLDELVTRLLDL